MFVALGQGIDMRGNVLLHVSREQQRGSLQLFDGVANVAGYGPDNAVGAHVPLVGFAGQLQCTDGACMDLQASFGEALALHRRSLEQRYSVSEMGTKFPICRVARSTRSSKSV